MSREKEIRQASIEYTMKNRPMCIGGDAFSEIMDEMNRNHAFEAGAKWADEHLNLIDEELEMMWQKKHLIEKACNWLEVQLDRLKLGDNRIKVDFVDKKKFIDVFKKAMED